MKVALPIQFTSEISEIAARNARQNIKGRGWSSKSSGSLMAFPRQGCVSLRTTLDYIMIQNKGFGPFIMWWAQGRVIPITDESGTHYIRAKGVGTPGYVTLPGNVRVWRDVRWRHPGLKPKRFMEDAISSAIKSYQPKLKTELMKVLGGESKV